MKNIKEVLENSLDAFSQYKGAHGTFKCDAYQNLAALLERLNKEDYTQEEITLMMIDLRRSKLELLKLRNPINKWLQNKNRCETTTLAKQSQIADLNERIGIINENIAYLSAIKKKTTDQMLINKIIEEIGIDRFKELQQEVSTDYEIN